MQISPYILGDFQTNCFIITADADADTCIVVDCGWQAEPLFAAIEQRGLSPTALLLTHFHADHMASVESFFSRFGDMPFYGHAAEVAWCNEPMLNLSGAFGLPITCREPDHILQGGETLTLNGETWRVVHTPGHSPGSVCFIHDASNQAIVGDTLFAGSIGRIDFPTSSPDDMRMSITQTIMSWPDEMTIYPGHGPETTIGRERATNPFVLHGF